MVTGDKLKAQQAWMKKFREGKEKRRCIGLCSHRRNRFCTCFIRQRVRPHGVAAETKIMIRAMRAEWKEEARLTKREVKAAKDAARYQQRKAAATAKGETKT
jgi:hypothetical protein